MKVTIQTRQVYHKYAEVEINVCDADYDDYLINNKYGDLTDYLSERDHLYTDEIDSSVDKSEYECGSGEYEYRGMNETGTDSEWRYECKELNTGGHL